MRVYDVRFKNYYTPQIRYEISDEGVFSIDVFLVDGANKLFDGSNHLVEG